MNTLLLPALLAALSAYAAPTYSPQTDLRSLRLDIESFTPTVEKLAATPLAPDQIPALSRLLENSLSQGSAASLSGQTIGAEIAAASAAMAAAFKGGPESAERRIGTLGALVQTQRQRHQKTADLFAGTKDQVSALLKKDPKAPGDALLHQAADELSQSDRSLRELERKLAAMDEQSAIMRSDAQSAQGSQDESQQALNALAKNEAAMHSLASEVQSAFANLISEPFELSRAKADQKRWAFLTEARGVYQSADVFFHREDDFRRKQKKFSKAWRRFDADCRAFPDGISEAGAHLDRVETLLNQIQAMPL